MTKGGRKIIKISLITLTILVIGGFFINWYMTYRLQDKLNKELSKVVYNATDGFYRFSFDHLSIGLFSGELAIEGLKLVPDSVTFHQWKEGDSLPNIYYDIHIGRIHFKGINLTWQRDYKKLNFSLFEINSPNIKIFEPTLSTDTLKEEHANHELKTLYQTVSPYINLLTVNRISLNNANISYKVLDQDSPVIYALQEANFQAYNFRLDENSSESGKLLYADNFEFSASKPQSLLYSDQVILTTNNIQLSTIDSIIKIEGVSIHPIDEYWEGRTTKQGGYLKANIQSVAVNGIGFKRENGLNYLDARTFDISSTDIQYYSVKSDSVVTTQKKDSVVQTWSLYSIISPILHTIAINKVGIEKTKFSYATTQGGYTDTYSLEQFDFHANKFLVDPLSEREKKFWYVDNFTITSTNINGLQNSNNSDINIGRLYLNTMDHDFSLSDIKIKPLSTNTKKDYVRGSIKLISVDGLDYNMGVSAEQIKVDSANIEYFKIADKKQNTAAKQDLESTEDFLDNFKPYSDFLSVKKINLKDANIIYHDRNNNDTYQVHNLNFYASEFLINDQTRSSSPYLFTYNDIGLSFRNFDNLILSKDYRLQIKKADISTLSGRITLAGLKLTPQTETWAKTPDSYIDFSSPFINISGFNNETYIKNKNVAFKSLSIESPQIKITKVRDSEKNKKGNSSDKDILSLVKGLIVNNVNITNIDAGYVDRETSLQARLDTLSLKAINWKINKQFQIGEFILRSPQIEYANNETSQKDKSQSEKMSLSFFGDNVGIGKFSISDTRLNMKQPDESIRFSMQNFDFSGLKWRVQNGKSLFDLAAININEPYLDIDKKGIPGDSVKKGSGSSKDFYEVIKPFVNQADIKEFNITNANINYTQNGKKVDQTVNQTNLDIDGLAFNTDERKFDMADIRFNTKDLYFPIMDGFYTLGIGSIDIDKKKKKAEISDIRMKSSYPKLEFAYKHPKHKDWFDVTVGDIALSGLDFPAYFLDNSVKAKNLIVKDVVLQNFKNQQIEIQHNIMPLIYEKIQQLPVKLDIDTADVYNFSVLYEELPKKGTIAGKIYFDNMNGKLTGLTNVASYPDQFIRLDANGKFMGGNFTARWDIPVSPDYDCFVLEANMKQFDLKNLNDIFLPLAKAELKSGMLQSFDFRTEASSTGATADMQFLYNDLKLLVVKDAENEEPNKFLSRLANMMVRSNNPNNEKSKPREAHITIDRDPYHSTFNYFWQILQPAVVESVGVSQGKQNFVKKVAGFFSKVKNFFTGKKNNEKEKTEK